MFGLFRRSQTPQDGLRPLVEDVLLRLANCEGQLSAMRTEWQDTKDQVRRSYQRMEKASERLQARQEVSAETETAPGSPASVDEVEAYRALRARRNGRGLLRHG